MRGVLIVGACAILIGYIVSAAFSEPYQQHSATQPGLGIVERLANLEKRMTDAELACPPLGTIAAYPGVIDDDTRMALESGGWFLCDGRAISKEKYPALYVLLSAKTEWQRVSAEKGKFKLPDLRGEFLRGLDQNRADEDVNRTPVDPDRKRIVGSEQPDQIKDHWHILSGFGAAGVMGAGVPPLNQNVGGIIGTGPGAMPGVNVMYVYATTVADSNKSTANKPVLVEAKETRPRNIAVNWIIRVK